MKERLKVLVTLLLYLVGAFWLFLLMVAPANEYDWMPRSNPDVPTGYDPDGAMRIGLFSAPAIVAALVILAVSFAFWGKRGRRAALAYALLVAITIAVKASALR